MKTLSILIPTKNRSLYLDDILSSVLKWKRRDFEIIIQDNSDDEHTKEIVSKHLYDDRVKYFLNQDDLSVIDNFDFAVKNSNGTIVTAIGDDDGILPDVMDVADWMINNGIDSVLTDKADYVWPDLVSKFNSDYNNSKLKFNKLSQSKYLQIDAISELREVCKLGGTSMGRLPRIYYGLVQRRILDIVHNITGEYFPGPSPDMANAVSVSLAVNNHYYYNFPIFIAGSSSKSTAGLGLKRKHIGKISEIKHLPKNTLSEWDSHIPEFWSGPTIWAQSASLAMRKMNSRLMLNYNYLYARTLVFFPEHRRIIFEKVFAASTVARSAFPITLWYIYNWKLRFDNLLPKLLKKTGFNLSSTVIIDNLKSISEAVDAFIYYIENNDGNK
ncbi:glycosyltransferase family 2 protein [Enterobacter cancerogenus]|uniref:glycosyltransferase family 2 protein n=1 Tax=Enterobacter cancerogenus TaxID=69218 RepID=UPI0007346561|nr:glycosyltransferase [Enterobacter cancerogenus]KTQ46439.1 hypothetical protein NS104_15080 [Enterobacter cancerogenus]KTQ52229.1 hypothetical protein NS111_11300 [Enterobacter cancerogenus]KTQ71903.1 hypothetical protein NS188_17140 [Enterobacter cancerogenus]KTQ76373.1 hypothetical protein NS31R_22525 [Enterobacter cancerogenus]MRG31987.1 glycosyltransferase [Enterobacter cancerogenus]